MNTGSGDSGSRPLSPEETSWTDLSSSHPEDDASLPQTETTGSTEGLRVPSVDAYVIEAGGTYNRYRWDATQKVLALDAVVHPSLSRGADLAQIPFMPFVTPSSPAAPSGAPQRIRATWIEEMERVAEQSRSNQVLAAEPGALGPALLVLILSQLSNSPGTRLAVRLLGALALDSTDTDDLLEASGQWLGIAVPADDPSLAQVYSLDDLPAELRVRLQRAFSLVQHQGPEHLPPVLQMESEQDIYTGVSQLSAAEVLSLYRESRAAIRRRQRQAAENGHGLPRERLFTARDDEHDDHFRRQLAQISPDTSPPSSQAGGSSQQSQSGEPEIIWRELAGTSLAERQALGPLAYAAPEHLLRWIPARFERYLSELLLPNEQVLFFTECPALTMRGWTGDLVLAPGQHTTKEESAHTPSLGPLGRTWDRLRTRQLHHGILLITEYQVLLLRDYVPPDATLVDWGYVARSWPLGRLVAATALPAGLPLRSEVLGSLTLQGGLGRSIPWSPEVLGRLAPVRRFDEATVSERYARLVLALEGARGIELTGAAFPDRQLPILQRAAELLCDFVPQSGTLEGVSKETLEEPPTALQRLSLVGHGHAIGNQTESLTKMTDRRVRAIPDVSPWTPTEEERAALEWLGEQVPAVLAQALLERTSSALTPGEVVLAQARTPGADTRDGKAALLMTLTADRLLLVHGHLHGAEPVIELDSSPLGDFSSAVLQHSLLSSGMVLHRPVGGSPSPTASAKTTAAAQSVHNAVSISFPSPLIVPMRALFTRARLRLEVAPQLGVSRAPE